MGITPDERKVRARQAKQRHLERRLVDAGKYLGQALKAETLMGLMRHEGTVEVDPLSSAHDMLRAAALTGEPVTYELDGVTTQYAVTNVTYTASRAIFDLRSVGDEWLLSNMDFKELELRTLAAMQQEKPMKTWKFKTNNHGEIDFKELAESVTRQNPLLLVNGTYKEDGVEHHDCYVVYHHSLRRKASALQLLAPSGPFLSFSENTICRVGLTAFADWVAWAKKVRRSPWPSGTTQRKAVYTATLAKV